MVKFDAVVPWEEFRPTLERLWRKPEAERKSRTGRKPWDIIVMFKTLVLSALYNLSAIRSERKHNEMCDAPMRLIGMVRAKAKIGMKNLTYNIRCLGQLRRLNPSPV